MFNQVVNYIKNLHKLGVRGFSIDLPNNQILKVKMTKKDLMYPNHKDIGKIIINDVGFSNNIGMDTMFGVLIANEKAKTRKHIRKKIKEFFNSIIKH